MERRKDKFQLATVAGKHLFFNKIFFSKKRLWDLSL